MVAEYLLINKNRSIFFDVVGLKENKKNLFNNSEEEQSRSISIVTDKNITSLLVGKKLLKMGIYVDVVKGGIEKINVNPIFICESDKPARADKYDKLNKIFEITDNQVLRVNFSGILRPEHPDILFIRHGLTGVVWGRELMRKYGYR